MTIVTLKMQSLHRTNESIESLNSVKGDAGTGALALLAFTGFALRRKSA